MVCRRGSRQTSGATQHGARHRRPSQQTDTVDRHTTRSNLKNKPSLEQLGFGNHFTDHMFIAEFESGKGWSEKGVVPYAPLALDPAAAVFHYGQALFEGLKAYRGKRDPVVFFRPEFNADRMNEGARRLCLPEVPKELFLRGLAEVVARDQDWLPQAPGALYIRPTLIGSEPFLGVRPSKKALFFVILSPVASYYKEGLSPLRIWVEEEYTRAAPGGLGATKAGANYASSLLAAERAKALGCAQVLWLDSRHHEDVEEVGTMNVFFKFKNEVVTPPLRGTILGGGTREAVLHLLRDQKISVSERPLKLKEILEAALSGDLEEMFGTGTAAVISPVGSLLRKSGPIQIADGHIGPLSRQLYERLTRMQYQDAEDPHGWVLTLDQLRQRSRAVAGPTKV